jgi:hypothetical protein
MTLAEILVVMIVNLLPSIKKTTNLPPLLTNIYSISIRYPSYRELYMYIRKEQLHTKNVDTWWFKILKLYQALIRSLIIDNTSDIDFQPHSAHRRLYE